MINLISLEAIKNGKLDESLEKLGYVRTKVMADRWDISADKINKYFSAGYTCDSFKLNGVRYISVNALNPKIWQSAKENKNGSC